MQAKENANKLTYAPGDSEVVRSTNKKRAPSFGEYLNEGLITVGRNLQKTNTDEMIRQAVANYQPDSDYRYKAGTGEMGSAKGLPAWADGEFSSANALAAVGKIAKNTVRFASDDTLPEVQAWGQKQMDAADELNRQMGEEESGKFFQDIMKNVVEFIPYLDEVGIALKSVGIRRDRINKGDTAGEAMAKAFSYVAMKWGIKKAMKTMKVLKEIDEDLLQLTVWYLGEDAFLELIEKSWENESSQIYPE